MFGTEQILKGYRSISPGERSVQSVRSGKHRAGFTEHRFTHDVPSFARYRLSTFSYRLCRYDRTELSRFGSTGTELTRFGSTGTELGSVQAERSVSTARFGPNGNTSS